MTGVCMTGGRMTDQLADEVSGDGLMCHAHEFARRVKLSGTAEERESFEYLRAEMEGIGFRTELLEHDAYISLPGASHVEVDGRKLRSITHSFSLPSPPGGLRAPLVYCGEGRAADFAAADVRGKVVLLEGIASPAQSALASAAGAAGQLHISPQSHLHEMCISPVWGSPADPGQLPGTVVCTVPDADGAALRERLRAGEAVEAVLHGAVDTGWRRTPLLEAELDGPDAAGGPFVLFTGHHDTWHLGVMDNGTANAVMIEVARVMAAHRGAWRRGLRLCFWSGHSHGRYSGSAWYADRRWDELDRRCLVHVNVDSSGGIGATDMTASFVSPELAALAAEAVRDETGDVHAGRRPGRNSDQSFWGIGVPSLFGGVSTQVPGTSTFGPATMRNALGWWWHTPHDTLDKIDPEFLRRDARVYVRALWRLLTEEVAPLDPAAAAAGLVRELRSLLLPSDEVPVAAVLAAADALAGMRPASDAAAMRACRALVPLDMTDGDRFAHDPALPQPPWPVLEPVRAWARETPGSDEARFAAVEAVRACNRLLHGLRTAAAALGDPAVADADLLLSGALA